MRLDALGRVARREVGLQPPAAFIRQILDDKAASPPKASSQIVPTTWSNLMPDFEAGKYDIAMGGISVTLDRAKKAYFSVAKQVGDLTAIVCAGLEARHAKHRPVLDRVLDG